MDRVEMTEYIANADDLPPLLKATAFMYVNTMSQKMVDKIGGAAGQCLDAIKREDFEELKRILIEAEIPEQYVKFVIDIAQKKRAAELSADGD